MLDVFSLDSYFNDEDKKPTARNVFPPLVESFEPRTYPFQNINIIKQEYLFPQGRMEQSVASLRLQLLLAQP